MTPILAQVGLGGSVVHWAIIIILVAAVVALVYVALNKFGIAIPDWVQQVFWILIVAIVVIGAILFLAKFAGFA